MYSSSTVEYVRSYNDIVSVISEKIGLVPLQNELYKSDLCPFCNDAETFIVDRNEQAYMCLSCGEGGDVFSYVMKMYNMTFNQAVEALARRMDLAIKKEPDSENIVLKRQMLYSINKEAARYFYANLKRPEHKDAKKYFKERNLSDNTIKHFGLGFAFGRNNDLTKYLMSVGYTKNEIIEAGLAVEGEYGLRDKFRNRVIFPIMDTKNRVIGFGGRVLVNDIKPKYLNSPDTIIFDKSSNLFGLGSVRAGEPIILCEGFMDVIQMQQAGYNAVASLGTAFTSLQAKLLKKHTDTVILSYDNDDAGKIAQKRAVEFANSVGLNIRLLNLSPVKDPDEYIKTYGKESFGERIKNSKKI